MRPIHQIVNDLWLGDAIGKECLAIQRRLIALGHPSEIFAQQAGPGLEGRFRPASEYAAVAGPENAVIWHFSIGTELTELVSGLSEPVIMRYHNITPAHFFHGLNPAAEAKCLEGRRQLAQAAEFVDLAVSLSAYSRSELDEQGYAATAHCPFIGEFSSPDRAELGPRFARLAGDPIVLHVGRISPQKRYEELLKTAWFLERINPRARLVLVGVELADDPYYRMIRSLAGELGLNRVVFTGRVSDEELEGFYRAATVYLCLSDHEGFCVPLVEAMHRDVCLVAKASSAVTETLGRAGVLLSRPTPAQTAETVDLLLRDERLRSEIVAGQRAELERFDPELVWQRFYSIIKPIIDGVETR